MNMVSQNAKVKAQKLRLFTLLSLMLGVAVIFGSLSCSPKTEPVTIAYAPFESTALLWVAEDQQFFSRNGLDVTLRKYETGAGALDGTLKGEADIVVGTAEFPVVARAFRKERMRIIGSADKANFIYIVARKDRGIEKASDLRGKKVGTTVGTVAEFYLGRFLELNGISMKDIELVDVKTPEGWVNAVADGDIDAIATAQPYAMAARDRLGTNAAFWPAQHNQLLFGLIISSDEWLTEHPELAARFLGSLSQAEEYLIRNPAEARVIVQERLGLAPAYVEAFWSQNQFGLSLDQSLVIAMEDQARWMISNNLTAEKQVPDFMDYIYEDTLKTIKPEAVNIVR